MKTGGVRASTACEKYSEDHGPLKIGIIVSLASGKLHSFILFHTVLVAETTPTDSAKNIQLCLLLFLRLTEICAGGYLPSAFKQNIIMKIVKTFTDIITQSDNKDVEVIRIVGDRKHTRR